MRRLLLVLTLAALPLAGCAYTEGVWDRLLGGAPTVAKDLVENPTPGGLVATGIEYLLYVLLGGSTLGGGVVAVKKYNAARKARLEAAAESEDDGGPVA